MTMQSMNQIVKLLESESGRAMKDEREAKKLRSTTHGPAVLREKQKEGFTQRRHGAT